MPAQKAEWTADMVRALPDDGKRYEVLDGELFVSPSPRADHQSVVLRLAVLLDAYVRQYKIGWVFMSPSDVEFSPRRYVQPDVFVVLDTGRGRPRKWQDARPIGLVAEVKSESTARADRYEKRIIYQDERIANYWIVDPDARLVECWTAQDARPSIVERTLTWQPPGDVAPFEIVLSAFFASALD